MNQQRQQPIQQSSKNSIQTPRRLSRRFNDAIALNLSTGRKNVAWGGEDFKVRSRSSSFSETRPLSRRRFVDDDGSIHHRDSKYYKENELLPDEEETDYKTKSASTARRYEFDNSKIGTNSRFNDLKLPKVEPLGKTSLPQTYPGKYPSPYIHKSSSFDDLLSSSAVKNFAQAKSNTRLNQQLRDHNDDDTFATRKLYSRKRDIDTKKSDTTTKQIMLDEQLLLDSIDQNISELDNITRHINGLKLQDKKNSEIELKYKEIRQELITELKKSKKLYDSYYQFVNKYRDLKKKYKENTESLETQLTLRNLQKENNFLKEENELLSHKLKLKEENDVTITDLKSSLKHSSNFEVTLRRKIKYLEDKIEQDRTDFKQERFNLNEKIYMLEMKSKDEEELHKTKLQIAQDRIRELEKQVSLQSSKSSKKYIPESPSRSIIPEYTINSGSNRRTYDKENDFDTINLLERKYPDRKLDSIKHSPEKRYSTGDIRQKRPTSLYTPGESIFKNLGTRVDDSVDDLEFLKSYKNNLGRNSTKKRYSISDMTFTPSEIG